MERGREGGLVGVSGVNVIGTGSLCYMSCYGMTETRSGWETARLPTK
jgi:hypothetical protein